MRSLLLLAALAVPACGSSAGRATAPATPTASAGSVEPTAAPAATPGRVQLFARFRDASGLPVGSRVVLAGLTVGEVSAVEIDGQRGRVWVALRDDLEIWSSAVVTKKASSTLGEHYLELEPGAATRARADGTREAFTRLGPTCPTYAAASRAEAAPCREVPTVVEQVTADELLRRVDETLPAVEPALEER